VQRPMSSGLSASPTHRTRKPSTHTHPSSVPSCQSIPCLSLAVARCQNHLARRCSGRERLSEHPHRMHEAMDAHLRFLIQSRTNKTLEEGIEFGPSPMSRIPLCLPSGKQVGYVQLDTNTTYRLCARVTWHDKPTLLPQTPWRPNTDPIPSLHRRCQSSARSRLSNMRPSQRLDPPPSSRFLVLCNACIQIISSSCQVFPHRYCYDASQGGRR
jgi:hypothetical protein